MSTISEAVRIIIGARDDASKVLEKVGGGVTRVENTLTDFGDTADKAGVDVGGLLNQFVGPEFGELGSQAQNATSLLSEFNAANVKGAKGLTLLKVGLVAATAVLAFKLGQALIGATKLNEDFNDSLERSRKLADEASAARGRLASLDQFKLNLIDDPEEKKAELKDLIETAKKNFDGAVDSTNAAKDAAKELNTVWKSWTGNKELALNNQLAEQSAEKVQEMKEKWIELQQQLGKFNLAETARIQKEREAAANNRTESIEKMIAKIREETNTMGLSADQLEQWKLAQIQAADATALHGASIAEQADAARKAAEQENALLQAQHERQQAQEEAATKKADESALEALREQLVLIRDGEEAAARFADVKAGLSKAAQDQAAELRKEIAAEKDAAAKLLREQTDAQKRSNDLAKEARKINREHRSDGEKAREAYEKLLRLQSEGLLTERAFAAEKEKIAKDFSGDANKEKAKQVGQLSAAESRFLTRGRDTQDTAKSQLEVQRRSKAVLDQLAKSFTDAVEALNKVADNTADGDEVFDG